jgi:hypothetical protein
MLALLVLVLGSAATRAQTSSWADKMFAPAPDAKPLTLHDFGSVPRGAQLYHRFEMTNWYAVPLQIVDVHTSCGCATATASAKVLASKEKGYIDVTMDGRRFTGQKNIKISVSVGPDFTSTAELRVMANARADIVFNPGEVSFGVVPRGETPTQTIDVEYAGVLDWKVNGINTNGAPYNVTIEELYRRPGQVGYRVRFVLQPAAPLGALKQEVFLQTNDPASPLVPVLVEANVQANLTVSPEYIKLTELKVGQELTRKVMVRGSKPFRVLAIDGGDEIVSVVTSLPSQQPLIQHTVVVKCQPGKPGDLRKQLQIKTDIQEAPVTVTLEGTAAP